MQHNVPFIEYGGDSLLAIEVLSRASRCKIALAEAGGLAANFEMLSIQDLVTKAVASKSSRGGDAGGADGSRPVILERSKHDAAGVAPKDVGGIAACAVGGM